MSTSCSFLARHLVTHMNILVSVWADINGNYSFSQVLAGWQTVGSMLVPMHSLAKSTLDIWLQGVAIILPSVSREMQPVSLSARFPIHMDCLCILLLLAAHRVRDPGAVRRSYRRGYDLGEQSHVRHAHSSQLNYCVGSSRGYHWPSVVLECASVKG